MNFCELFKHQGVLVNYLYLTALTGSLLLLAGYCFKKRIFYLYFFYFLTAAGIFLLKIFNRNTSTEYLSWILYPTTLLTELLTGLNFQAAPSAGYGYPPLNITIDKSCAGINFLIVCLLLTVFSRLKNRESLKKLSLEYTLWILSGLIITIVANSLRITGAVLITRLLYNTDRMDLYPMLHQAEGILVYLSLLILYYLLLLEPSPVFPYIKGLLFKNKDHNKIQNITDLKFPGVLN